MSTTSLLRSLITASAILSVVATSACSGGGGAGGVTPPVTATGAPAPGGTTTASVTIVWPTPGASSSQSARRKPAYLSDATASVTIAYQGKTTQVSNPNLALTPGGTTVPTQKSSTVLLPVTPAASVSFTVTSFDTMSRLLGSGTTAIAVTNGQLNNLTFTLDGNLASIVCTAVAPTVATGTTGTAFMQVGIAGELLLTPKDPDGFTIVAPGNIPALTLTASDATMAGTTPTSTANEFQTRVTPVGTAEKFVASGTDLNGATHTTTCTITRDAAMYVTNVPKLNAPGQQSITIYDATVLDAAATTVAQAPVATIAAPAGMAGTAADLTGISEPQFLAVDTNGYLFVTNQGPLPGIPYGPKAGYVAIYAPGAGQSGNVPPVAFISGLNRPEGIAFDSKGVLYVLTIDSIYEYAPAANGETAPAVVTKTISGPLTDLNSCYGMHVDATFQIYTACSNVLNVFAAGATGNATPTELLLPAAQSINNPVQPVQTFDSVSWLDIAPDSTGAFYAPASNNNADDVYQFQAGATNGASGIATTPVGFSQPTGIAVDASDGIYVTNVGSSSVVYYANSMDLMTSLTDATLSGTATGLNSPFGVTVR